MNHHAIDLEDPNTSIKIKRSIMNKFTTLNSDTKTPVLFYYW